MEMIKIFDERYLDEALNFYDETIEDKSAQEIRQPILANGREDINSEEFAKTFREILAKVDLFAER